MDSLRAGNCLTHICVSAVGAGLAWSKSPTTGWVSSMGNQCQMGNFQMDQKEVCLSFLSWEDLGVTLWWYQLKVKMGCEGVWESVLLSSNSPAPPHPLLRCGLLKSDINSWLMWVTEPEWAVRPSGRWPIQEGSLPSLVKLPHPG